MLSINEINSSPAREDPARVVQYQDHEAVSCRDEPFMVANRSLLGGAEFTLELTGIPRESSTDRLTTGPMKRWGLHGHPTVREGRQRFRPPGAI